ncbi:hypothetical protein CaCOL14_001311 [Colletotrichum acutatum]
MTTHLRQGTLLQAIRALDPNFGCQAPTIAADTIALDDFQSIKLPRTRSPEFKSLHGTYCLTWISHDTVPAPEPNLVQDLRVRYHEILQNWPLYQSKVVRTYQRS